MRSTSIILRNKVSISQNPELFGNSFHIFDNASKEDRNCRMCTLSISSTIPADLQFWQICWKCRESKLLISSTIPAGLQFICRKCRNVQLPISSTIPAGLQFCRNCRRYRKPTIPAYPADYRNSRTSMLPISSTIPADLSVLPGMSKADHSGIFGI